jgi:hypothetical protein
MAPGDIQLKERFAEAFLRDPEPMRAAIAVVGALDMGVAIGIATNWPHDPYVLDVQAQLISEFGADHFLPDKLQLARAIWAHAENTRDPDAKTKALKLYGEVTGILNRDPRGSTNIVDNRTMVIVSKGSGAEWEAGLRKQQDRLFIEAEEAIK